jgi:hypothetical protein
MKLDACGFYAGLLIASSPWMGRAGKRVFNHAPLNPLPSEGGEILNKSSLKRVKE